MRRRLFILFTATLLGAGILGVYGLLAFERQIPLQLKDASTTTDAIVVLTGGSSRLDVGVRLLRENKAKKLLISGVGKNTTLDDIIAEQHLDISGIPHARQRIALGYIALTTNGNAQETALWMNANKFTSLRLVTASYHMPRSLLELNHLMPGVTIIPHPVFTKHVKVEDWRHYPGTRKLILLEYAKYLAAWVRMTLR